jgi:hypothetical protein
MSEFSMRGVHILNKRECAYHMKHTDCLFVDCLQYCVRLQLQIGYIFIIKPADNGIVNRNGTVSDK